MVKHSIDIPMCSMKSKPLMPNICRQVLRHDIGEKKQVGTISEAYPHLILENFSSALGKRVGNILRFLFPAPKARCASPPLLTCLSDGL